ncbi:unnamed protein product [Effrenium voratum]|nr:unnamed protein product [Effrenium voratum]
MRKVAIKTNVDVFYLSVGYDLSAVLADNGPMAKDAFQRVWTSAPPDKKAMSQGAFGTKVTAEMVASRLQQYYCYLVAQTQGQDVDQLYFSCSTTNKLNVYCELSLQKSGPGVRAVCCSEQQVMLPLFQNFLSELLQASWALVEELKLVGDRLHYKRLTGTGPEEGWVSTKISGKELLSKKEAADEPAEDVGGPGEASGPVALDEALKSKIEADCKAKKDDFLLYCMKYKVLGFPLEKPKLRVLAFHNAGSAESIYTGPGTPFIQWIKETKQVELMAFDYPGRDKLLKAVAYEKLTDGVPYIVWGHSVGLPMPLAAFLVTFPAPHYPEAKRLGAWRSWHVPLFSQGSVLEQNAMPMGSATQVVFEDPGWKDTWEPMMRADFKLFDEYKFKHAGCPKFDFPLHCWWCNLARGLIKLSIRQSIMVHVLTGFAF